AQLGASHPLPPALSPVHDTANPYPPSLSLHDALPIWRTDNHGRGGLVGHDLRPEGDGRGGGPEQGADLTVQQRRALRPDRRADRDRKSTRLNSSHVKISYAVFCLKKKKNIFIQRRRL